MAKTDVVHAPGFEDRLEAASEILDRLIVLFRASAGEHGETRAAALSAVSLYALRDDKEVMWIAAAAIKRLASDDGGPGQMLESVAPED